MMQCKTPLSIKDPNSTGSSIRLTVPCGKCYNCLSNRRTEWTIRLEKETRVSTSAWFLTLTYTDENLPWLEYKPNKKVSLTDIYRLRNNPWIDKEYREKHNFDKHWQNIKPSLYKKDFQLFMKRIRKEVTKHDKKIRIKYYAVGEYGTKTKRPHYHAIIFNVPIEVIQKVAEIWNLGHCKAGDVNTASIHYVTKYVTNPDHKPLHVNPEFTLISNGIGRDYIEKNKDWHRKNSAHYIVRGNHKARIPRYYADKTFNKFEKEKNKREQIKNSDETYWKEVNKAVSQGDNYYEKQKQSIIQEEEKLKSIQTKKAKL